MAKPLPAELGISRSNLEALVKAWMKAQYGLNEATHEVSFKWNDFEYEVVIYTKRK